MESIDVLEEKKKRQNFIALSVILGGLFVGSIFVDFVQLATGNGFSARVVKNYNVLQSAGKTWVGYSDPKVGVSVISDDTCEQCDPNEALVWLRRVIPTIEATKMSVGDEKAKSLIEQFEITSIPAFVFSDSVSQTDFYSQASSLFQSEKESYFFDMTKIGLQPGKYLSLPSVSENDITTGKGDAKITVAEFSDFECEFCKIYHKDLTEVMKSYGDEVRYVYKALPLSFHLQAENAALAAYCANEQGKFSLYADYLFSKQDEWSKSSGKQKFKDYAWWLRLNGRQFSTCMDENKYSEKIAADSLEAENFSIHGTPGTFVNGTFLSGAVTKEELKQVIDQELSK